MFKKFRFNCPHIQSTCRKHFIMCIIMACFEVLATNSTNESFHLPAYLFQKESLQWFSQLDTVLKHGMWSIFFIYVFACFHDLACWQVGSKQWYTDAFQLKKWPTDPLIITYCFTLFNFHIQLGYLHALALLYIPLAVGFMQVRLWDSELQELGKRTVQEW